MSVSRKSLRRCGIVDVSSKLWTAGSVYTKTLAHSLREACRASDVGLVVLSQSSNELLRHAFPVDVNAVVEPPYFRGEWRLRSALGLPAKSSLFHSALLYQIDVLVPVTEPPPVASPTVKAVGWIPDFQHVYLPQYFSSQECEGRDQCFKALARDAALVMLSSRTALEHFTAFAPEQAHKARVASFPSLTAFEPLAADVRPSVRQFHLPDKFALIANQFWEHKNHMIVVEALALLRRKGIRIPAVMTGLPADYRRHDHRSFSHVLQRIAAEQMGDQITVLGLVDRAVLMDLLRATALVLQPSRFEGWSTTVQDAKALGRPLLCSDLPIHREQAPGSLGFFPCDRADVLAEQIESIWPKLEPGPCPEEESRAHVNEREFARRYGETVLHLCQEAYSA
ncbi:MAG TPA: glycosyltransferase [Nitrospiraceae bacterium]|nr:glycosyltransferase [Nitrospiraceae bacterium]